MYKDRNAPFQGQCLKTSQKFELITGWTVIYSDYSDIPCAFLYICAPQLGAGPLLRRSQFNPLYFRTSGSRATTNAY